MSEPVEAHQRKSFNRVLLISHFRCTTSMFLGGAVCPGHHSLEAVRDAPTNAQAFDSCRRVKISNQAMGRLN
jgi:hypothetical protein